MDSIHPGTRCGRCGKLFHQHPPHKNGTPGRWEVGHVIDGNNLGPLRIEHSTCNRIAGGQLGYSRGIARHRATTGATPRTAGPHFPGHYNLADPTSIGAPPCVAMEGRLCRTCSEYLVNNPKHK